MYAKKLWWFHLILFFKCICKFSNTLYTTRRGKGIPQTDVSNEMRNKKIPPSKTIPTSNQKIVEVYKINYRFVNLNLTRHSSKDSSINILGSVCGPNDHDLTVRICYYTVP